jgi:gliding motility-associated lipoprotein GldH
MRFRVFALCFIASLWSCDNTTIYQQSYDLEQRQWGQQDIKVFDFTIEDVENGYDVYLTLRNSADYSYNNIFIDFSLIGEDGVIVENRTKEEILFDPASGQPTGTSSIGDVFSHTIFLMDTIFPTAGDYRLSIRHYMRTDQLPEVLSVGARIAKQGE